LVLLLSRKISSPERERRGKGREGKGREGRKYDLAYTRHTVHYARYHKVPKFDT